MISPRRPGGARASGGARRVVVPCAAADAGGPSTAWPAVALRSPPRRAARRKAPGASTSTKHVGSGTWASRAPRQPARASCSWSSQCHVGSIRPSRHQFAAPQTGARVPGTPPQEGRQDRFVRLVVPSPQRRTASLRAFPSRRCRPCPLPAPRTERRHQRGEMLRRPEVVGVEVGDELSVRDPPARVPGGSRGAVRIQTHERDAGRSLPRRERRPGSRRRPPR